MKTLEERFDEQFSNVGFIPENRIRYLNFIRQEIERALDAVVPSKMAERESPVQAIHIDPKDWNDCRDELLKNIEEYKKDL